MLTYHGLFKFDKEQAKVLDTFAAHYNHIYHKTYKIWCQQQDTLFLSLKDLSAKDILKAYIYKDNSPCIRKIDANNTPENNYNTYMYEFDFKAIEKLLPKLDFTLKPQYKKELIAQGVYGRHLNSILKQLKGNLESVYQLTLLDLNNKIETFNDYQSMILKAQQVFNEDLFSLQGKKIGLNSTQNHSLLTDEQFILLKRFIIKAGITYTQEIHEITQYNNKLKNKLSKQNSSNKKVYKNFKKASAYFEELLLNHKNLLITPELALIFNLYNQKVKDLNNSINKSIINKKINLSTLEERCFQLINDRYNYHRLKNKSNRLKQSIHKTIVQLLKGKLPICFGSKKLFSKQFNLNHYIAEYNKIYKAKVKNKRDCKNNPNIYNHLNHHKQVDNSIKHIKVNDVLPAEIYKALWKEEFIETRNKSFYIMGCKTEAQANLSCQGFIQDNGLITLKLRLPDNLINNKDLINNTSTGNIQENINIDKYLVLKDLDFKSKHELLVQALSNFKEIEKKNKQGKTITQKVFDTQIHYRFEKCIEHKSPKYGAWTISFQIEEKIPEQSTYLTQGAIGIDLNQEHLSVSHTDKNGNLLKAYDMPLMLSYTYKRKHKNNQRSNHNQNKTFTYKYNQPLVHNNTSIVNMTSAQSKFVIEQIVKRLCQSAKEECKPIVVESLDFEYKKKQAAQEKR